MVLTSDLRVAVACSDTQLEQGLFKLPDVELEATITRLGESLEYRDEDDERIYARALAYWNRAIAERGARNLAECEPRNGVSWRRTPTGHIVLHHEGKDDSEVVPLHALGLLGREMTKAMDLLRVRR